MSILNQIPTHSVKNLTPLQAETLNTAGIITLGDLLAILPRRLDHILPWTSNLSPNLKYSHIFEIKSVTPRKSSRGLPYMLLQISDGELIFQGFMFSRASFIINKLRPGLKCEMVVSIFGVNQGIFTKNLSIHKVKFESQNSSFNDLDKSNAKDNLDIFYPKISTKIDTTFLRRVHARLSPSDYKIDLSDLAPKSLLGTQTLDLYDLHHPNSYENYQNALNQYQVVQVFLKTALQKYIVFASTQNTVAVNPALDLAWLQDATKNLPVTLTQSQKSAIWEILQDVTLA